jgi:hypothetical protein
MNQAINFFWTILGFAPVVAVWATRYSVPWLCVSVLLSVPGLLLPSRVFQLSRDPKFYERLGIRFIQKFVQGGRYASRYMRKLDPGYRMVKNKATALQYQSTLLMYERFHLMCFIFFVLTAAYAFSVSLCPLALIVILANLIYNICPILLQQYNRARILKLVK